MADFPAKLADPVLSSGAFAFAAPIFAQPIAGARLTNAFGVGNWVDVPNPLPVAPQNALGNAVVRDLSPGEDWFERIHLLPRPPGIDFGSILNTVDNRFELFNAYRRTRVVLTGLTDPNVGVVIPDFPALPYSQEFLQSIVDPLTANGLAPLGLIIRALRNGPGRFDANFVFRYVFVPV